MIRVASGVDVHAFGGPGPVRLGGVDVPSDRGLVGTSDADPVMHAIADAVLGAAALGDLGAFYPSADERWHGADSADILEDAVRRAGAAGVRVTFVDVTVVAQTVRIGSHRDAIRAALAGALDLDESSVSVKATTTDHLGFVGRDEGIAAWALVTCEYHPPA